MNAPDSSVTTVDLVLDDKSTAEGESPWRALEYFASTRVIVAAALVFASAAFGTRPLGVVSGITGSTVIASLSYFAFAALFAGLSLYLHRHFLTQVIGQLALDLVVITALVVGSGGVASGWVILFLLPLAGASLLLPSTLVFFVCSIAVLAILIDSGLRTLSSQASDPLLFLAGVYGAALFGVTALLRALSSRLANQERLARSRGRDLQNQLAINRLVIAQMQQGVIVVDPTTQVRANNRAARRMLGLEPSMQLTGVRLTSVPSASPLAEAFMRWVDAGRSEGAWSNTVMAGAGVDSSLSPLIESRMRARFARPTESSVEEFVIFIEDVRDVENRAQQLKLAAMGRLTASIAHEIRNPLAAISHAGQLMGEDSADPMLKRLAGIVRENTQRLNRLVEDVLRVARREPPLGDEIDINEFVQQFLSEFIRDRALAPATIQVESEPGLRVKFEQSHLRQVLYNLVDNALRYASKGPKSVRLVSERAADQDRPQLWVFDDGTGVPPEARAALFEPFFTTRTQGTGLGLYLAREFCVTNRADLSYSTRREFDGASRDGFLLRFGSGALVGNEQQGFLDTLPIR